MTVRGRPAKTMRSVPLPFASDPLPRQIPRDYGPEVRRSREAAVSTDPLRLLIKEDRLDPAGKRVRGARTRDPLLKMYNSRIIAKPEWDAVEMFRDDHAIAQGARLDQPDPSGVRTAMNNRNWPSDERLDALRRIAATWERLDLEQQRLAGWLILQHRSLREYERAHSWPIDLAMQTLRGLLNILVNHHEPRQVEQ